MDIDLQWCDIVIFLFKDGWIENRNPFNFSCSQILRGKLTMNSQDYGLAAAIGILVFVICATLSLIVYNNSKSMKDEEAFS